MRHGHGSDKGAKRGMTSGLCYSSDCARSKGFKMIQIILNDFKTIQASFDLKRTFLISKNLK
jgi:hypothetical protein